MALKDIFNGPRNAIKDSFRKSLDWLNDMMSAFTQRTQTKKSKFMFKSVNMPEIGKMYFFMYHDPLTKKTLPYWDKFPLIIPVEFVPVSTGLGILGLNLHYLPPLARASLLDALVANHNDETQTGSDRRISINYDILKAFMAAYPSAKICIKKYAMTQILSSKQTQGRFAEIDPADWKFVVTLPLHEWVRNPNYSGPLPW